MNINGNEYTFEKVCQYDYNDSAVFSVTIFINGDTICTGECIVYNDLTLDSTFIVCKAVPITVLNREQLYEICKSAAIQCRQSAEFSFHKKCSKSELKKQYKDAMSAFYTTY